MFVIQAHQLAEIETLKSSATITLKQWFEDCFLSKLGKEFAFLSGL